MARKFSELREQMSPKRRAKTDALVAQELERLRGLEVQRAEHFIGIEEVAGSRPAEPSTPR